MLLKFSGIVKAKPEDMNQFENTYEKIVEIFQIESGKGILNKYYYSKSDFDGILQCCEKMKNQNNKEENINNNENIQTKYFNNNLKKENINSENCSEKKINNKNLNFKNISFPISNKGKINMPNKSSLINFQQDLISTNLFFVKHKITGTDLNKFQRLSGYKCLSSFVLLNILDNKIYSNYDFMNMLLYLFAFSKGAELSINIFDLTKTENISNQVKNIFTILSNLDANYFNFNNDNKTNEDFLIAKEIKKITNKNSLKNENGNFEINLGEIFQKQNDFLFLDQIPLNVNNNIQNFIHYSKILKYFNSQINLSVSENSLNHPLNFSGIGSLFSNTKVSNMNFKSNELLNSNLFQMINYFDINLFYSDKLDSEKDRKKTNQILKEQFEQLNNQINSSNRISSHHKGFNDNSKYLHNNNKENLASNNFSFKNKRKYKEFSISNPQMDLGNSNRKFDQDRNENIDSTNNYYGNPINSAEDILALEDLNYFSFLKRKIKEDLNAIRNDGFLSEILNSNYEENYPKENNKNFINKSDPHEKNNLKNNNFNGDKISRFFVCNNIAESESSVKDFFSKFVIFVNSFINPKIENDIYNEICYLAKSLEEIFYPIKNCEFLEFPLIEKLLLKFCFIKARIDMREKVLFQDVFESFLFVKEYLSICLTFSLANRKEIVNKNKKTKLNFVMEKIRQLCESENRKTFSKTELKNFCDEMNLIEDLDNIIETLNFNGFMIKLNKNEYQLA